jgi:MFS family permease
MKNSMSWLQIGVVALCFLLNFNDGIDVLLVSFAGEHIMKEWGLNNAELGYVFSAGLAGMTAGCFVLAPLGDLWGRRKVFLVSLFLISLGMLLVYFAPSLSWLMVFRFVTGLGIGGILPNLATVASEFSTPKARDFNVGIVQGGWPLGAILTGFVVSWVFPMLGWRATFLIASAFSFALLILVYFFLPESPGFEPQASSLNKMKIRELFTPAYRASTFLLWTAIFFGFLTLYTLISWVPTLAKQSGMPFELATYVGMTLNFGAFTGVFVMGLAISKIGIKKTMTLFFIIAFILMNFYGNVKLDYVINLVLVFFIGFLVQGGFNSFYPAATRIYPAAIRSSGVGLAMGAGRFGAIMGPTVFGLLTDSGMSVAGRFLIFSLPILVAVFLLHKIKSKELS